MEGAKGAVGGVPRKFLRAIAPLFAMVAAALCVFLAFLDSPSRLFLLLWCLMPLPAIALHEAGHLLGGWLVGFRFYFLTLGRLGISRNRRGRIRLSLVKGRNIPMGIAGSLPTDDCDLRRRLAVMIGAGPATNLLVALLSGGLFLSRGYDWDLDSFLASGASVFGFGLFSATVFSLFLALVNLVPCRVGGFTSDGATLLLLLRGGPKAERQTAISVLVGMSYAGRRARGWPPSLVEKAIALPDGSAEDTAGAMLAYYRLLDQGDAAGAAQFLDRALAGRDRYPTASRPKLFLEAAYFTARHRGDAAGARNFLKQSKGGLLVQRWAELRAEAAVLLAEGNRDAARLRAQEGLAAIRRMGSADAGSENADWLREIIVVCDSAAPSTPSVPETSDRGMA